MNNARLKFRVWLPDENRYLHNTDCPVVDSDGNLMWCYLNPFGHWEHHKMENAVIEQCTGLTDRHNKLIYENDVVNMYIPYEDNHRKCVVQYVIDEGTAQWLAVYLEGSRKHQSFGKPFEITSEYLDGSYCTVIGNIHDEKMVEDKDND